MNNKFDDLAKLVLNEANIGDYIRKATRAAVRGVAKVADIAAKDSGMKYSGTFGNIANKMKDWGDKHKAEIEKRDLNSAPYKLLSSLQDRKLLPTVGEYISTVMPDTKQIVSMQVVDVSTDAAAAVSDENKKDKKVNGGVTVVSQPVARGNKPPATQFDTAVTKIADINNPLKNTTTTTFYKNNAATRISQLNAIITKVDHDPMFGNRLSWQLRAPSLRPEFGSKRTALPAVGSIYANPKQSYIFLGSAKGGWAAYTPATKKTGAVVPSAALQAKITQAWQAHEDLNKHP